jgi:hypothetical protein
MSAEYGSVASTVVRPEPSRWASTSGHLHRFLLPVALVLAALAGAFVFYAFAVVRGLYTSDWWVFYQAGVRLSRHARVYTVAAGFFNPPPVLLPLRAAVLLPYLPSRVLWATLSAGMLLFSAALTADACGWRPTPRQAARGAWWILWAIPTVLLVPLTGNFSAVVLLGLALALWLFGRGHDGWAGASLALTLVKPQLAFLTLPLLLYRRRTRAAAGFLVAAVAAVALSLPVVGPGTYRDYVTVQQDVAGWTTGNQALQLDVPGVHGLFLQAWPGSAPANAAAWCCMVALVAALAWYWRGPWRPGTPRFAVGWALLVLVTLLVSPFAHSYDQVLLILPMTVCYAHWRSARWVQGVLVSLYVAPGLVLLYRQHFAVPAMLAVCVVLWAAVSAPQSTQLLDENCMV